MMLKTISTDPNHTPPIIGIYGAGGIGKTTFAASFPSPVFLLTEDGTKSLTAPIAKVSATHQLRRCAHCDEDAVP